MSLSGLLIGWVGLLIVVLFLGIAIQHLLLNCIWNAELSRAMLRRLILEIVSVVVMIVIRFCYHSSSRPWSTTS